LGSGNNRWRSFEEAREYVRGLGLKNHAEWREWAKSGERPADIPARGGGRRTLHTRRRIILSFKARRSLCTDPTPPTYCVAYQAYWEVNQPFAPVLALSEHVVIKVAKSTPTRTR